MIVTTTIIGHLFRALRRSLSRVFLLFLITGLIAVVVTEIIDIVITGKLRTSCERRRAGARSGGGPYSGPDDACREVFRDLIASVEELGKDFAKELTSGPALVEKVIEQVERRI